MRTSVKIPLLLVTSVVGVAVVGGSYAIGAAGDTVEREALEAARHNVQAYATAIEAHLDTASAAVEIEASHLSSVARGTSGPKPSPTAR